MNLCNDLIVLPNNVKWICKIVVQGWIARVEANGTLDHLYALRRPSYDVQVTAIPDQHIWIIRVQNKGFFEFRKGAIMVTKIYIELAQDLMDVGIGRFKGNRLQQQGLALIK